MAGLAVDDIVAAPLAASTSALSVTQKAAGCVLINIGSQTTSMVVWEDGVPLALQDFDRISARVPLPWLRFTITHAGSSIAAAIASDADRRRALDAGFQVHLSKPVDPAALVATVAVVGRPAASIR